MFNYDIPHLNFTEAEGELIPLIPDPEALFQKVESPQSLLFCKPHGLLEVCQSMLSDELKAATMVNLEKRLVGALICLSGFFCAQSARSFSTVWNPCQGPFDWKNPVHSVPLCSFVIMHCNKNQNNTR